MARRAEVPPPKRSTLRAMYPEARTLDEFWRDSGHVVMLAKTGGGKSEGLRTLADRTRQPHFWLINTTGEDYPGFHDVPPDRERIAAAVHDGHRKLSIRVGRPAEGRDAIEPRVWQVVQAWADAGEVMMKGGRKAPFWLVFGMDEMAHYSAKHDSEGAVLWAYENARKYGVVVVGASQEPTRIPHVPLTQAGTHLVGRVGRYRVPYLEEADIPVASAWEHLMEERWGWLVVREGYQYQTVRKLPVT